MDEKYQAQTEQAKPGIMDMINRENQNQAMRQDFRERIAGRLMHAQQEANRERRLRRLVFLLDKNPEVCEIIDLLQGLDLLIG